MPANEPNRNWKFMLVESSNMAPVGWIKNAREKKISLELNKAGSISFTLRITDAMAYNIIGNEIVMAVVAYCDNSDGIPTARWSGPIWTTTMVVPNDTIAVNCVGWFELLNYRELRTKAIFDNLDAGEIATRIINDANHTTYLTNLLANWSFEADAYGYTDSGFSSLSRTNIWSTTGGYSEYISNTTGTDTLDSGFIEIDPNTNYYASLDINVVSILSSQSIRLDILWYDSSEVLLSTTNGSTTTSSGEQTINVSGVSPGSAAYAVFRFRCQTSSGTTEIYIDTAIFTLGSESGVTPTPITIGDVTPSQNRDITYDQGTKHGSAIETLVNMEAGFDWHIDPLTREFSVFYENIKGTIYGRGTNNTSVEFAYGWGSKNVAQLDISTNSSVMANRINAKGKYTTGVAYDTDSVMSYGLFEDTLTLSDVSDADILVAYAGAETAYRLQPFKTYTFTPFPYDGSKRIPRVFDDYDIGDIVYLTAKYGAMSVERQAVRVFGVSIDIDNEGNEKIGEIKTVAS